MSPRPRFSLGTFSLTKECDHKRSRQPPNVVSVNTSCDILRMHCVILPYNSADHVWLDRLYEDRGKTLLKVPTEQQPSCSILAFPLFFNWEAAAALTLLLTWIISPLASAADLSEVQPLSKQLCIKARSNTAKGGEGALNQKQTTLLGTSTQWNSRPVVMLHFRIVCSMACALSHTNKCSISCKSSFIVQVPLPSVLPQN